MHVCMCATHTQNTHTHTQARTHTHTFRPALLQDHFSINSHISLIKSPEKCLYRIKRHNTHAEVSIYYYSLLLGTLGLFSFS